MASMTPQPFLSIVTRCCQRPKKLGENISSVESQSCSDIEQVFIVDRGRKGIQAADRALAENKGRVLGQYVYILDDDCKLIDECFVETLKDVTEENRPDVVMVKSRRPPGPPSRRDLVPTIWQGKLRHGSTNCLCYVIKAALWKKHIHMFGVKPWGGDWWFLEKVLMGKPSMFWLNRIVADARQLGRGRIFERVGEGWFETVAKAHGLENLGKGDWRLRLWK